MNRCLLTLQLRLLDSIDDILDLNHRGTEQTDDWNGLHDAGNEDATKCRTGFCCRTSYRKKRTTERTKNSDELLSEANDNDKAQPAKLIIERSEALAVTPERPAETREGTFGTINIASLFLGATRATPQPLAAK